MKRWIKIEKFLLNIEAINFLLSNMAQDINLLPQILFNSQVLATPSTQAII